jgi:hypothetical protein
VGQSVDSATSSDGGFPVVAYLRALFRRIKGAGVMDPYQYKQYDDESRA